MNEEKRRRREKSNIDLVIIAIALTTPNNIQI